MAAKPMMKSMMKRLAGALFGAAAFAGAASAQIGGGVIYPGTQPDTLLIIIPEHTAPLQNVNCFTNSNQVGDFFGVTGSAQQFYTNAEWFFNGGAVTGPQTSAADSQLCFIRMGQVGARARVFGAEQSHGYEPMIGLAINAGGSGYNVNDTITLAGSTYSTPAVVTVTACVTSCPGAISTFNITNPGAYIYGTVNGFTQASTSGNGTGATFKTATYGAITPNNLSALQAFTGAGSGVLTWTQDNATYTTAAIDLGASMSLPAVATTVQTAVRTAVHNATLASTYGATFTGSLAPSSCGGLSGYVTGGVFTVTGAPSNCIVVGSVLAAGPTNPTIPTGSNVIQAQISGTPGGVGVYSISLPTTYGSTLSPYFCNANCTLYWSTLTVAASPTPTGTIATGMGLYDGPNLGGALSDSGINGLGATGAMNSSCTGAACAGTTWVVECGGQCGQGNFSLSTLAINAAGSGYAVGDTITLASTGTQPTQTAIVKVLTLSGSGVSTFSITFPGNYVTKPSTFTQASTSGSGSGATFQTPTWSSSNGNGNAGGIASETMYAETCHLSITDQSYYGATTDFRSVLGRGKPVVSGWHADA